VSFDEDTPVAEAAKALCEQETYTIIVTHDNPTLAGSSKQGTIQGLVEGNNEFSYHHNTF
jgi:hypothetical protein